MSSNTSGSYDDRHQTVNVNLVLATTRGSCSNNGQPGAKAIYQSAYHDSYRQPSNSTTNLTGPVPERQTSQRAALEGPLQTMRDVRDNIGSARELDEPFVIGTSNKYVVDGMNDHSRKWEDNGYRNAKDMDVVNRDMFREMNKVREELRGNGWDVKFEHEPNNGPVALSSEGLGCGDWDGSRGRRQWNESREHGNNGPAYGYRSDAVVKAEPGYGCGVSHPSANDNELLGDPTAFSNYFIGEFEGYGGSYGYDDGDRYGGGYEYDGGDDCGFDDYDEGDYRY